VLLRSVMLEPLTLQQQHTMQLLLKSISLLLSTALHSSNWNLALTLKSYVTSVAYTSIIVAVSLPVEVAILLTGLSNCRSVHQWHALVCVPRQQSIVQCLVDILQHTK
jgi:hypothetical protein